MELDQKWETNWDDRPAMGGDPSKPDSGSPGGIGKTPQTWKTNKAGLL